MIKKTQGSRDIWELSREIFSTWGKRILAILKVALTVKVLILNYLKRLNQTTLNKINLCLSISGIQRRSSEPILGTTPDPLE